MNLRKNIGVRMTSIYLVVSIALINSCAFSAKPIYFDKEITVAERAASRFHELHNQQNFRAIYDLLDKQSHPSAPENVLSEIRANYDKLGQSLESRLVEKKAFPSPGPGYTSRVKLAYETKFEKGDWTEFFAWNIRDSNEAMLVEYLLEPTTRSPNR
ncbi:MAG TPA: hypothetical protein VN844_10570 [Pyrinomonadaceae bacterium]|nr:hypothetical protein [Pyrinomonadaceae bacterium]